MSKTPKLIGVIYPLPKNILSRIFQGKKTVFVKFTTHEPTKKTKIKTKKGTSLFLYQSGSGKILVGEAKISNYEYLQKDNLLRKYKTELVLTEEELHDYARGREEKHLLVLHLDSIKRYKKPIQLNKQITMTGQTVTEENRRQFHL